MVKYQQKGVMEAFPYRVFVFSLKKKFTVVCICVATCIGSSGISIYAQGSPSESKNNDEINACPLPREEKSISDEEFISFIEDEYNISRNDENVFIQYNGNNTTSIAIVESQNKFTVLTSPTQEESEELANYNENSKGIVWTAFVWLMRAYNGVKYGCQIIQGVSGVDVCGEISNQIIDSLVAYGTRKRFKVIRYVEKKPCPYPPSSLQCNQPPFAYWRTTYQAY